MGWSIENMVIRYDGNRALKTLLVIEPILSSQPVSEQEIVQAVRTAHLPYDWQNNVPPELRADLEYLHGICGLQQTPNGMFIRDRLTEYWCEPDYLNRS